mmetsp:Transcript_851/g.2684  ORF Transcript_851/g.2684 Transcript_851/m.2684 type:complete len:220 (-) Transcript_851:316-975(-)
MVVIVEAVLHKMRPITFNNDLLRATPLGLRLSIFLLPPSVARTAAGAARVLPFFFPPPNGARTSRCSDVLTGGGMAVTPAPVKPAHHASAACFALLLGATPACGIMSTPAPFFLTVLAGSEVFWQFPWIHKLVQGSRRQGRSQANTVGDFAHQSDLQSGINRRAEEPGARGKPRCGRRSHVGGCESDIRRATIWFQNDRGNGAMPSTLKTNVRIMSTAW